MTNINDYCSYELAKKLKDAGFDWECSKRTIEKIPGTEREEWDDDQQMYCTITDAVIIYIPTLWQAAKWLREVKGIEVYAVPRFASAYEVVGIRLGKTVTRNSYVFTSWDIKNPHPTYEAALSAGIDAALELIINKTENHNGNSSIDNRI